MPQRLVWMFAFATCFPGSLTAGPLDGKLTLTILDSRTNEPVAARLHLWNSRGRVVRVPGLMMPGGYSIVDGVVELELPAGDYSFELERGPEYRIRTGNFSLQRGAEDAQRVVMERSVDMAEEGWYSGDLDVNFPREQLDRLMRAEDLHFTPAHTLARPSAVEAESAEGIAPISVRDSRPSGALWLYRMGEALNPPGAETEIPPSVEWLLEAKRDSQVISLAETPFAGDLPVWLASGRLDGILLANRHLLRDGVVDHEAGGMPRDRSLFPPPHGVGRWSEQIYFQLLNAGLRLPPGAGSGSGGNANPLGYSRVYVHCGEHFTQEAWWEGFRAGRVVVTNGPMLRPRVNGQLPGHVFTTEQGAEMELEITLQLATREKIEYLEVIRDGRVLHEVRLDEWAKAGGYLPTVTFHESGWLAIRAVTNNTKTYRFALSGPYYVQVGYEPRISRGAAEFFLQSAFRRARELHSRLAPSQREQVIRYHRGARDFWQRRVEAATVD